MITVNWGATTNAQVQNTAQFMARSGRGRGTATVPSVVVTAGLTLATFVRPTCSTVVDFSRVGW